MRGVWNWIVTRTADYGLPKQIELIDIVQILLIAFFVYHLIRWLQNTKAYTLMKGIFLIGVFVIIANVLKMQTILWLFGNIGGAAITAVVIIFQPELRRVVEQIGEKNPLSAISFASGQEENERFSDKTINELVRASFEMGEVKTGALIVIEKTITLEEYEKTGIPIDGVLTSQLLINIFEHNTPLHDGAVIVRNNRVTAATCYLPLSDNMDLNKNLGTRHRAGVGISEVTDSFTIIVSEETGNVSYASGGELHTAVTPSDLREQLHKIQKLAKKPEEKKDGISAECVRKWRERRNEKENSEKASEQSPFENSFYPDCHCNLVRCGQCE